MVQLAQKAFGYSWKDAHELAERYGDRRDILSMLERPLESIESRERHDISKWERVCHPYWKTRHIASDSVSRYHLGFDDKANRAVVPHFINGECIGWQKRAMNNQRPKWLSSVGFPKNDTVFGLDEVKGSTCVIVEAPVSAIWLTQCGYPAIATFGSGVSYEQSMIVRKNFDSVVLWYDPDDAGRHGRDILVNYLYDFVSVYEVVGPVGDPNEVSAELVDYYMSHIQPVKGVSLCSKK